MRRNSFFTAFFKGFTAIHIRLYRLSAGRIGGRVQSLPVLILTTVGRRTGKTRNTPLGYFEHAGSLVIVASNAGFETHPAWYHNLLNRPQVEIQVGDRHINALAQVAESPLRELLWAELVERAPGYRMYEQRTTRAIPLICLHPFSAQPSL